VTLEAESASTHQISMKSDDFRPRYSDKSIFKMAAVRHLELSKFRILVTHMTCVRTRFCFILQNFAL